jgi:putative membrane protein
VKGILTRWLVSVVALYITAWLAQLVGLKMEITGILSSFIAVVILAVVNAVIRPIVLFFAMPLNCLTFGLFGLVVNALLFWLVGSLNFGFKVGGFWSALFGSIVMGIVSGLLSQFVRDD